MATYSTVKYGSKGSTVKQLQTLLNNNGAKLSVDGIFGDNTLSALKKYQKSNGLSVDGIAGVNTWGALTGSSGSSGGSGSTGATSTPEPATPDQTTPEAVLSATSRGTEYDPAALTANQADMQYYQGNQPGEYQSQYGAQIDEILGKILNREPFEYDLNADMLYQQYNDRYIQQGQKAMQDTMANAASLTGGYGNTYASTVGNQAYQSYLQGLNDRVPELYDAAYRRWRDEGNDMVTQAGMLQSLDDTDYGRYRDDYGDYYNMLSYYTDQVAKDQEQANWQAEMAFAREQYEAAQKKSSGSSGGGSSRSSGSKSSGSSSSATDYDLLWGTPSDGGASQSDTTSVSNKMTYSEALKAGSAIARNSSNEAARTALGQWQREGRFSSAELDGLIRDLKL